MVNDKKWIILNVGGSYFTTSRSTLTKSTPPNSPLYRISSNSTNVAWDRDERGAYVIDRDPNYFRVVLNYLRYDRLLMSKDVPDEAILLEAEYFNLPELMKEIKLKMSNRQRLHQMHQLNTFSNLLPEGVQSAWNPFQASDPSSCLNQLPRASYHPASISSPFSTNSNGTCSVFSNQDYLTNYVNSILGQSSSF